MNYDPISYFNLTCPSGGDFYICQGSKVQFLGCCDLNPCSSRCPSHALHPAAFDRSKYSEIGAQSCVESTSPSSWYTCRDGQTFIGCCVTDPCNGESLCPEGNLVGARLADDPRNASKFLTATTAATVTSVSLTPTPTGGSTSAPASTVTVTQIPSPVPTTAHQESSQAPTGGIVGGVLGGLLTLILLAFIFFKYRKRRRRGLAIAQSDDDALQLPWSPYHDSFRGNPSVPPAPVSPLSTTSTRHRISASLSSIIGLKRGSAAKRQSPKTPDWVPGTHTGGQASPGFLGHVAELESLPPGGIMVRGPLENTVHFEVEGSTAESRAKA